MHPDTMKFVNESGLQYNVEKGVSELTKTIRNLRVLPSLKVMLHKIINTALYVGEIAHNYQVMHSVILLKLMGMECYLV